MAAWEMPSDKVAINSGKRLNDILGENARNMFIYGLLTTIGLLL